MSDDNAAGSRPAELLGSLEPKTKEPASARILNTWIAQAEDRLGGEATGGRLGWLVATSVAIAAVQRAVDLQGRQLFLLKGGTLLQHRLGVVARATKDVDGQIRGDLDSFFDSLSTVFDEPWGPVALRRGPVTVIDVPTKVVKPCRFDVVLSIRGVTWRRIRFEVSPDEAGIGEADEQIEAPPLGGFGLPDPDVLVGVALRFQIAQKIHAVSDPHVPPDLVNDRARDVVDLLLLRDLSARSGAPTAADVRQASMAVFEARATEAMALGKPARGWPPTIRAHAHWGNDFRRASAEGGVDSSLTESVARLNKWVGEIAGS